MSDAFSLADTFKSTELIAELLPCAVVLFLAMVGRSAFGFGHGAFAMPLLLLFVNAKVASPLLGTISFTVSIYAMVRDWRDFRFGAAYRLTLGALIGIPIGIVMLVYVDARLTIVALSATLMILSLRSLLLLKLPTLADDKLAYYFGFLGGVLGGAFNLTGIPAAIYGNMRGWSPSEFRITLTGYFLITACAAVIGYYASGLLDEAFVFRFILCLAPAFLGNFLGKKLNQKMDKRTFEKWTWSIIFLTSLFLCGRAIAR